jgi:hypothetical protein
LRPLEIKSDDDASKFLRLACITYFGADHPSRRDRARQIFAEKPHLAKANLYSAAAVGDVAAVADFLTRGADVHAKGGPFNWEPLLYAAYSRLDSQTEGHSAWVKTTAVEAMGPCGSRRMSTGASSRGSCSTPAKTPTATRGSTTACSSPATST